MVTIATMFQVIVSIVLVVTILVQVKGQGTGLFGSAESSFRTRRGMDKLLFQSTIVLIGVFIGTSIVIASGVLE